MDNIDKAVEVAKIKGLLNGIRNGIVDIKFNCAVDNVEKTYSKLMDLMPYVEEIDNICAEVKREMYPTSEEAELI